MPLGIELKSEQKLDEMVQIMASLHKYVPMDTSTQVVTLPDETTEVTHDEFFPILLGTCVLVHGTLLDHDRGCV